MCHDTTATRVAPPAQNVRSVALAPWLFIPGLFTVATVLAYNFVGDGLRDAAAPYT